MWVHRECAATATAAAQLVERQGAQLRFKLPGASAGANSISLSDAFKSMESNKAQLHIREYALSQTTLEQIFNDFAGQQEEETGGARGVTAPAVQPGAQQRTMAVQLPPSATPGMEVEIQTPDGNAMKITVPAGTQPGQVITVAY